MGSAEESPLIELRHVYKSFKTKNGLVTALDDVSFSIGRGDIFGIIGMSGAGKSTLVRCINFLEKPTSGEVVFNGQPLAALPPPSLRQTRRQMGMIFQQFNLLMQRTVLGNVLFPLEIAGMDKAEARRKAEALIERVGLADKAQAYPAQLSGGQKQRVAIARALATDPQVLLCDEATSALDPNTTHSILELLKDINRQTGITVVLITHEMRVVEEICRHVAILDNSRLAETGRVLDIFTDPRTSAARRLFFPEGQERTAYLGSRCCRVVFDGSSSFEPVIAQVVLDTRVPLNILFADTRNIDGKAYGQMILQLPQEELAAVRVLKRLRAHPVTVEEVTEDVME